jgi:hypothetical protein
MIAWRKSSFSDTPNSCVEVRHESDVVYVRDSKLGDDSPVLRFAAASWLVLTDAIVAPRDGDPWKIVHRSIAYEPDGHVLLSTSDRSPELRFDADEWKAFVYGVRAGEFDPEKLSEEVTSEPGCDGSDKAATGAVEEGCRTPGSAVPVAAPLNVPAGRPGEDTPPVSPGLPAVTGQPGPLDDQIDLLLNFPELVEAVACAEYEYDNESTPGGWYIPWGEVLKLVREQYEWRAEAGIRAAYPLLRAQWESEHPCSAGCAIVAENERLVDVAEAWNYATAPVAAPLVPAVETQETVS